MCGCADEFLINEIVAKNSTPFGVATRAHICATIIRPFQGRDTG